MNPTTWIGADGAFTDIGRTGKRRFVDDTLPMGCSRVTYKVQAVRSTAEGQCATFNVNIGVASPVARGGHATLAKLAA